MAQVPLHHHWGVRALPRAFSDFYQGKGRSCLSHLVQNSGSHPLGRLRTMDFSQHSATTCVSHTSGCSSWQTLDTQQKHPGACYGPSAREHCDHSPGSNSSRGSSELVQLILPSVKEDRIASVQVTLKSWLGILRSPGTLRDEQWTLVIP